MNTPTQQTCIFQFERKDGVLPILRSSCAARQQRFGEECSHSASTYITLGQTSSIQLSNNTLCVQQKNLKSGPNAQDELVSSNATQQSTVDSQIHPLQETARNPRKRTPPAQNRGFGHDTRKIATTKFSSTLESDWHKDNTTPTIYKTGITYPTLLEFSQNHTRSPQPRWTCCTQTPSPNDADAHNTCKT